MPKVYISPERRQPPHGKYWGLDVYESDLCYEVAHLLVPLLQHNGFEAEIAPLHLDIHQRAAWANRNGVDFYLPLHTNASTNGTVEGSATGCEMLAFRHPESRRACGLIYRELTKLYPSKRGLKDGSAYVENNSTNMVSAYTEVAFHDNGRDASWLTAHKPQIAEALCRGICAYYAMPYQPLPDPQPPQGDSVGLRELGEELQRQGLRSITL